MRTEFHPIFFPFYKTVLVERQYYKESLKYKELLFSRSQEVLKLSCIMINTIFFFKFHGNIAEDLPALQNTCWGLVWMELFL